MKNIKFLIQIYNYLINTNKYTIYTLICESERVMVSDGVVVFKNKISDEVFFSVM